MNATLQRRSRSSARLCSWLARASASCSLLHRLFYHSMLAPDQPAAGLPLTACRQHPPLPTQTTACRRPTLCPPPPLPQPTWHKAHPRHTLRMAPAHCHTRAHPLLSRESFLATTWKSHHQHRTCVKNAAGNLAAEMKSSLDDFRAQLLSASAAAPVNPEQHSQHDDSGHINSNTRTTAHAGDVGGMCHHNRATRDTHATCQCNSDATRPGRRANAKQGPLSSRCPRT